MDVVTTLPWGRPLTRDDLTRVPFAASKVELIEGSLIMTREQQGFTRADLDEAPDDGHRYELIGGALVVTPAPSPAHQGVSLALTVLLYHACPAHLVVRNAPLDVVLADDDVCQPDILVAPHDAFTARDLPGAPLLAVEILSPSTRLIDLNLKKASYEMAGCASYWVVDPIEARFIAWELRDGAYVEVADITGDQTWTATAPYDVTVCPADLVR